MKHIYAAIAVASVLSGCALLPAGQLAHYAVTAGRVIDTAYVAKGVVKTVVETRREMAPESPNLAETVGHVVDTAYVAKGVVETVVDTRREMAPEPKDLAHESPNLVEE